MRLDFPESPSVLKTGSGECPGRHKSVAWHSLLGYRALALGFDSHPRTQAASWAEASWEGELSTDPTFSKSRERGRELVVCG